jgi:hypothetical protein
MRIVFDHKFGHQEQGEFFHFGCELLDVATEEHDYALSQGFLMTLESGQVKWYQCRSTRVSTANTDYQLLDHANELSKPLPVVEMDHIYTSYCYYKKFKKYYEIGQALDTDRFLGYYQNNALVAWTKMRPYSDRSIETALFVWDYSDPDTRLGLSSLQHEIAWAKQQDYEYVYLGPGYERSSLYKSKIQGFEWWTGSTWSQDVDQYNWLCSRDSKIKNLNSKLYDL